MTQKRKIRFGTRRGATQIEFVLSILVVMFLIFWIFELLMAVYTYSVLSDAAKEATRYAIVHHGGSDTTINCGAAATTEMVSYTACDYAKMTLHDVSAANVAVTYPDGGGSQVMNRVKVTVTYTYVPYINLSWASPTLHATSTARIVF